VCLTAPAAQTLPCPHMAPGNVCKCSAGESPVTAAEEQPCCSSAESAFATRGTEASGALCCLDLCACSTGIDGAKAARANPTTRDSLFLQMAIESVVLGVPGECDRAFSLREGALSFRIPAYIAHCALLC